jgi:hypothetical protein
MPQKRISGGLSKSQFGHFMDFFQGSFCGQKRSAQVESASLSSSNSLIFA